jgi:ATP-dependent RNA helicase RhlE
MPNVAEQYVHRIGRTARAGADGTSISFVAPDEKPYLKDIEKLTGVKLMPQSLPDDFQKEAARLPAPTRKPAELEQDARRDERDRKGRFGGGGRGAQGRPNNNRSNGGQSRDGQSRDQHARNEHVRKEWAPRSTGPVHNPLAHEERIAGVRPDADRRPARPDGERRPARPEGDRRPAPHGDRRPAPPHGDRRPGGGDRSGPRGQGRRDGGNQAPRAARP